jgi:hypothetical protein
MKMPRLRSILITFLLSVSFVIPACTSKPPIATETPTQKATETPTQKATETPTQKATETPTQKATETPTQKATETATPTTTAPTRRQLAPIPEMVQNVVNSVHQKIKNGEIDLAKENNLNIGEINITTTGGGFPFGSMIYVQNINTKDLITIGWVQSANGYELLGYSFPSQNIKFNCSGPCRIYYPQ